MCGPGTWAENITIVEPRSWLTARSVASFFPDFSKIQKNRRPCKKLFWGSCPGLLIPRQLRHLRPNISWVQFFFRDLPFFSLLNQIFPSCEGKFSKRGEFGTKGIPTYCVEATLPPAQHCTERCVLASCWAAAHTQCCISHCNCLKTQSA